jgi:SSS family solute:Na+ symporter
MVFLVIGLALIFGLLFPTALVSLQLLGVSGMVQIFPAIVLSLFWQKQTKEATIIGLLAGLGVTFTVYGTGLSFGVYEGFWGLSANFFTLFILNPIFSAKTNHVSNYLFKPKKEDAPIRKGA